MTINNEKDYQDYRANMEIIIAKGTKLGDMELLSDEDKAEFVQLSHAIAEYESVHHPLPGSKSDYKN